MRIFMTQHTVCNIQCDINFNVALIRNISRYLPTLAVVNFGQLEIHVFTCA